MRISSGIICRCLTLVSILASLSSGDDTTDSRSLKRGSLVICGGGKLPGAVRDRFIELAGGSEANLVVIPTASGSTSEESFESTIKFWNGLGIKKVTILHSRDRKTADSEEFVAPLTNATAVWISGGAQSRLAEAYLGTSTEKELNHLLKRGGVIGGTSAGAAIQSRVMIQSGNPVPKLGTGFDLLPNAIIDQHFLRRNRFNRLLEAMRKNHSRIGVGIAESTALIYRDGQCEVMGKSVVTLVRPKVKNGPFSIDTYAAGEKFSWTQPTEKH